MKKRSKSSGRPGEVDYPPPPRRASSNIGSGRVVLGLVAVPYVALAQSGQGTPLEIDPFIRATLWPALVWILALIFINAVLTASETAMTLLRPSHARAMEKDEANSKKLNDLLAIRIEAIGGLALCRQTILWWIVISSLVPAVAVAKAAATNGVTFLTLLGWWLVIGIPIAAVNLIFGDLIPRTLSVQKPVQVALRLFRTTRIASLLFKVPSRTIMALASIFTNRFGARATFVVGNQAEEEIKSLAESAEQSGELEVGEKELLHSVFEFTDTIAREIMTPRVDMDALPITATVAELVATIQETGRSRIPIFESTDDQIIGFIHAKDLLAVRSEDAKSPVNLRTLLRKVMFVPENKGIHDLLREMRVDRYQLAIIQDEFGGTAGLVTIEDIVEELVGEIVDEYDKEVPDVLTNGSGWIVAGKTNLYDLNSTIHSDFESDEFDTVGGYVFGLFGRQPNIGEKVRDGDFEFEVLEADGRRITSLHVVRETASISVAQ